MAVFIPSLVKFKSACLNDEISGHLGSLANSLSLPSFLSEGRKVC